MRRCVAIGLKEIALGIARNVEQAGTRTKGYSKTDGMLTLPLALVWLKLGCI